MNVQFTVGTALVQINGSVSSVKKIRNAIDFIDQMAPIFIELEEIKNILPVAGAANSVQTIRAMAEEIAKLRKQVQVKHEIQSAVNPDDD